MEQQPHVLPSVLPRLNLRRTVLLGPWSVDQATGTSQYDPKYGIIEPHKYEGFGGDES